MKKIIEEITTKTKEYLVFDNYVDYLKAIAGQEDFTFEFGDVSNFSTVNVNGDTYYSLYYWDRKELLTKEAYQEFFANSTKFYALHESLLIRTQKNSNTRYTGKHSTIEEVIAYMRDDNRSWLPTIYEEINEEIMGLQKRIEKLNKEKETLLDDEYLKSKIIIGMGITNETK